MRQIDGYVCIARTHDYHVLFGENKGAGQGDYQNFESNDLTPYKTIKAAKSGLVDLKKRKDFLDVKLGRIRMAVAEKMEEFEKLRSSKSLAVIKLDDVGSSLMGKGVDGLPGAYPLPGAYMTFTNYKPFDSLDSAIYAVKEVNRQAACGAKIAKFRLEAIR